MYLLRAVFVFCICFFTASLFGQTTDTVRRADSPVVRSVLVPDTLAADVVPDIIVDTTKKMNEGTGSSFGSGYSIYGKVVDGNTGEGLPFATVFFPHTEKGTAADLDGNFIIKMKSLPGDTLQIEALGYKSARRILKKNLHTFNYIIELERSAAALDEMVFRAGEDPAVLLMRAIIAHKPDNNTDKVDNYRYEAYNRLEADLQRMTKEQFAKMPILRSYGFIFDNLDTVSESTPYLPLYLTETISDYYRRQQPKKQREFIKASMVKGVNNENVDKYLGTLYQNVNVYRNYIPVFDKKFVSPISDDALFFYKYKIIDTQVAYGHNIILVQFRPRRSGENCFTGDFWVADSIFALQRISMDVPKTANINWVDRASLYQEFAPTDSFWFCIKDKFVVSFSAYNSKRMPGLIGRKTTTYHKIVANDAITDSVLDNKELKEDIIRLPTARDQNDDWWEGHRPDSLSKNEKAIYKMVDTINKMPITEAYKNTITFLSSGVKDIGPLQLGPYFYIYSRNPVEGHRFRVSLGTPRSIKDAHFTGYLAYGTRDHRFKYGGSALWLLQRKPRMYLYGTYMHDISPSSVNREQLGADNIFSTLFRKHGVPWKLAFADDIRLEFYKEYFGGFSHKLIANHRNFQPYRPLPTTEIFRDVHGRPAAGVISSELGIEFRYAYKEKYFEGQYLRVNLSSKYPVLKLEVAAGLKGVLNGAYEYKRALFTISEHINIPPFGHIKYNLYVGKYFGTLPYTLLRIHPGNEFLYYNQHAFQMMNQYEFISDKYTGFNIEHNIGGGVFNYIPILKKLRFRQLWTAKGVVGSLSKENRALNLNKGFAFRDLKGDPYLELGTGVSNILEIFRLDFVWRVSPVPVHQEAKSRYFGIFGSVRFQF